MKGHKVYKFLSSKKSSPIIILNSHSQNSRKIFLSLTEREEKQNFLKKKTPLITLFWCLVLGSLLALDYIIKLTIFKGISYEAEYTFIEKKNRILFKAQ